MDKTTPLPELYAHNKKKLEEKQRKQACLKGVPTKCEIRLNTQHKPQDVEDVLFDLLAEKKEKVSVFKFWSALKCTGLIPDDPRLKECHAQFNRIRSEAGLPEEDEDLYVDRKMFQRCVTQNIFLIGRAFKKDLVIPEFHSFCQQVENVFLKCKLNDYSGQAPTTPQLARVNPRYWAVSLCTIDGQRAAFGDTKVSFCLQSCCMPLNYALAVSDIGADKVHQYVGFEPSGSVCNDITLNHVKKPHNPMVNSGALVTGSLIKTDLPMADRFEYVFKQYRRLCGEKYLGYNNAVYLSERSTSDRNFSLAYHLREHKCFPANANILDALEFYFHCNAIEVTAESGAVIAATLANGGICPITGERVLAGEAVRNTLSLMHSCGMYGYSGQFAFKVGLPAKSGAGGAILLIVPRVMGICTYSPPLDDQGNSCRGIQFCEELVQAFNFHHYERFTSHIVDGNTMRIDPRKKKFEKETQSAMNLLFGAANGDVTAVRRFALSGMNMDAQDYDGRTALHVAAAEGQLPVVCMLIEQCHARPTPRDRWGFTPLDDARRFGQTEVAEYLQNLHLRDVLEIA